MVDLAIIGGGAGGLAAAVRAAELTGGAASIAVFEATDKVGRPILRSGNGRCNFSHLPLEAERYRGAEFVAATLAALESHASDLHGDTPNAVLEFFARLGLVWRPEADGRLYPLANRASVVLDCLLRALTERGVELNVASPVRRIVAPKADGSPWTLELQEGTLRRARQVIVATGGATRPGLLPADVAQTESVALLGPLRLARNPLKAADGQRLRCLLMLRRKGTMLAAERGEVLFRTYGVSGIATMNLSRDAMPGDELVFDFLPQSAEETAPFGPVELIKPDEEAIAETTAWLRRRRDALAKTSATPLTTKALLCGLFSRSLGEALCGLAELRPKAPATDEALAALAKTLRRQPLTIEGPGPKDACQIHRGGVARTALDPTTMAVRAHPGLYVVGEAVDVDGPCGGYNLHWAWASALVAAEAACALQ